MYKRDVTESNISVTVCLFNAAGSPVYDEAVN